MDKIHKSRHQIHRGHILLHVFWGKFLRIMYEKGNSGTWFKPVHLVPQAALPEHVTVVAGEDDDCVAVEAAVLEHRQQSTDLVVDICAGGVVGTASSLDGFFGHLVAVEFDAFKEAGGMTILRGLIDGDLRKRNVDISVLIPQILSDGVWIMRVSERDGQGEWTLALGWLTNVIVQILRRLFYC